MVAAAPPRVATFRNSLRLVSMIGPPLRRFSYGAMSLKSRMLPRRLKPALHPEPPIMRGTKREIGVTDFQSEWGIQGRRKISKSGDRDRGAELVSSPRLDSLDHEALLSTFPPPLKEII